MFNAIIIHVAANWQLRPYVDIPHMCSRPLGSKKGLQLWMSILSTTQNILHKILKTIAVLKEIYAKENISDDD